MTETKLPEDITGGAMRCVKVQVFYTQDVDFGDKRTIQDRVAEDFNEVSNKIWPLAYPVVDIQPIAISFPNNTIPVPFPNSLVQNSKDGLLTVYYLGNINFPVAYADSRFEAKGTLDNDGKPSLGHSIVLANKALFNGSYRRMLGHELGHFFFFNPEATDPNHDDDDPDSPDPSDPSHYLGPNPNLMNRVTTSENVTNIQAEAAIFSPQVDVGCR